MASQVIRPIRYFEKGEGLHRAIIAAGLSLYELDGQWTTDHDLDTVQAFIDNYKHPQEEMLEEIKRICEEKMQNIRRGYPDAEVLSWDKQEQEARAGGGPLVNALAAARGVPVEDLCQRIIAKADAYATVCGLIIGTRQQLEDRIMTGEPNVTWPEGI